MSDIAIRVQNITKAYQIYDKPQERLKQSLWRVRKQFYREFKALDDVSFEVKKGETVGIIGRNGSGKSTLLQIICGTLAPTSGTVEVNGRVAALLELGAGFNPEFSGKENVYMNATILGLSKEEIDAKYEDIVTFADIGDFIDQPVKTYSSGMYVRLAFAVNIMVSPEIMIVDEALSVGDMSFQAKCMTALTRIQEAGSTVLFVSHDIGSIKSLCSRAVYLDHGNVVMFGNAADVAEYYVRTMREEMNSDQSRFATLSIADAPNGSQDPLKKEGLNNLIFKESDEFDARVASLRYGTGEARITFVEFLDKKGGTLIEAEFDQEVLLKIYFISYSNKTIAPAYYVLDDKKNLILGASPRQLGVPLIEAMDKERFVVTYRTRIPLQEGTYSIQFQLTEPLVVEETAKFLDVIDDAIVFKVGRRSQGRIWTKVFISNTIEVQSCE